MRRFTIAAVLLLCAFGLQAQTISGEPFIAVHGKAKAEVVPDIFPLEITLKDTSEDAARSQALIEGHAARILATIKQMKVADADVLRATFPAGTVSGAPKIRALEVIRELEPVKRNVYSGAVGYIGWHGDADTAIAIRTAVIQDGRLHVQAGGGVVYDSDPDAEWLETMNKGRALFRAVAEAAKGL